MRTLRTEADAGCCRQEATAEISGFTLHGSASLRALAVFYGFTAAADGRDITLGDYMVCVCGGKPDVGDRAPWGRVELIVREADGNAVTKVCLQLVPLRDRRRRGDMSSQGPKRRAQDRPAPAGRGARQAARSLVRTGALDHEL